MQTNSRPVSSSQTGLHPRLESVVRKHLTTDHRPPPRRHNDIAFSALKDALADHKRPIILDSFCGTGHSTAALAEHNPAHLVIGIDQSGSRLTRHPRGQSSNYRLIQANCEALWALMAADGLCVEAHYLLYPNPWPKPSQLQRRVHGHPGFADLLRLGGQVELRSNWQLYVEEFGVAMQLAGAHGLVFQLADTDAGLSLFERKYHNSGQALWVYRGTAGACGAHITP